MVKVLALAPYAFLPARSGGQKNVALFYKYLSRELPLTCITTKNNAIDLADGYTILPLLSVSRIRYINIFYFFKIRNVIRSTGITHLMLEHPYYGWLGVLLKKFARVRLIVHSHNIEGLRWKTLGKWWWSILSRYERWVHRACDQSFFIHEEDRQYAIRNFGLQAEKCSVITYGVEETASPQPEERKEAAATLRQQHHIPDDHCVLLFTGALSYGPNRDAALATIDNIHPQLAHHVPHTILICGGDVPDNLRERATDNIVFTGFVEDLRTYLLGSDVFLNAVMGGGGIKTKLVEGLGHGMNAVSTETGAIGVSQAYCTGKLIVVDDGDWVAFAFAVEELAVVTKSTPPSFYEHFSWKNIARNAADIINSLKR